MTSRAGRPTTLLALDRYGRVPDRRRRRDWWHHHRGWGPPFGLSLFVLGSLGQVRGAQLARAISRHERPLQLVLGAALLAVGVCDLTVNLPLIVG